MGYTLHDLMAHPDLGLVLVNPDIDPTSIVLRWITICELPDPGPWLDGGEMLLVTGLTVPEHRRGQEEYVERLVSAEIAALGFASNMSFESPPEGLRNACLARGIPLLDVPYRTPFVAITQAGCRGILDSHYRQVDDDLRLLEEMGGSLLDGTGLRTMLDALARSVAASVTLVDSYGNLLGASPSDPPADELRVSDHVAATIGGGQPWQDGRRLVWPILMDQSVQAFLVVDGDPDQLPRRALRAAATLLGIELSRQHALLSGRRELLGQVLQDVLTRARDDDGCRALLERYGINPTVRYRAVFVARSSVRNPDLLALALAAESTDREGAPLPTGSLDEGPVVLVEDCWDAGAVGLSLAERLRRGGETAPAIGIGQPGSDVQGLRLTLFEATRGATTETPRRGDQPGPHRLSPLLAAVAGQDWADLAADILRPLQEQGQRADLVATLRCYLEKDAAMAETAAALFIHRHTLHYRLHRIHELCGLDPTQVSDLAELRLALMVLDLSDRRI